MLDKKIKKSRLSELLFWWSKRHFWIRL